MSGSNGTERSGIERVMVVLSGALLFVAGAVPASAGVNGREGNSKFCTQTAQTLFAACKTDALADWTTARAICLNTADTASRDACIAQAKDDRTEAQDLCDEQRATRLASCKVLGEERYDPIISPADFDDPAQPSNPNPYFPLTVGQRWVYRSGNELNTVEVADETKLIIGVTCAVVRDLVFRDGALEESTDDWYCPAKNGDVWYFGEATSTSEVFPGDQPQIPEIVSVDGSFKAGRNGDKPGIIFKAFPHLGDAYVEEASLGNAEDVTEILSVNYSYGSGAPELDELVPKALVDRFCAHDCVVTKNYSLLEPGIFARKYYAPGVGVILEVEPDENKAVVLESCNFDPRCE